MSLKRAAITVFLVFHMFAAAVWAVPIDSPLTQAFRNLIGPYVLWVGFFQKWDMFSPDPSRLNNFVSATIVFRNGSRRLWVFPRMEMLGYADRYAKERYRKYANDNLRLDSNAGLWPDAARYAARVNNDPSNPPVSVVLTRYWSEVPGPGGAPVEEAPWQQFPFFRYQVSPKDLL
jgi:hypothetical protein